MAINMQDDIWLIPSSNVSYTMNYSFDYTEIDSIIFKNEIKKLISEILDKGLVDIPSVYCYYSELKNTFIPFVSQNHFPIDRFSEISEEIAEKYVFFLKSRKTHSRSSNCSAYHAIKTLINFGIMFKLPNFPQKTPFPENVSRTFSIEDDSKGKSIPDADLDKIKVALNQEKNVCFKAAVTIANETGLRISEILEITSHRTKDGMDESKRNGGYKTARNKE